MSYSNLEGLLLLIVLIGVTLSLIFDIRKQKRTGIARVKFVWINKKDNPRAYWNVIAIQYLLVGLGVLVVGIFGFALIRAL